MDRLVFLDHADDRAGEIVVTRRVQVGELRRLAAGERHLMHSAAAGDACDDLRRNLRHEIAGGDVVEKREWRRSVHEDVVDGMIDEIFTDRVVNARGNRHEHFRAHAVGRHDEHRLRVAVRHAHHAAEAADLPPCQRRARPARQLGDAALRLVGDVELDARGRVAVGLRHSSSPSRVKCTRSRKALTRPRTSGSETCSSRCTPNASTASDPIAEP